MKDRFSKSFLIYGFFFVYPITAPLLKEFSMGGYRVNSEMVWMFAGACLFFLFALRYPGRVRFSAVTLALLIFNVFYIGNTVIRGFEFVKTDIALILLSFLMVLLIENLDYDIEDRDNMMRVLTVLSVVIFAGSLLQVYVDHSMFYDPAAYDEIKKSNFGDYWRNSSLFDAMIQNEGGIAFIVMSAILLFANRETHKKYLLFGVALLLIVGFYTYTRYVLMFMLFSLAAYLWFYLIRAHLGKRILVGISVLLTLAILYTLYWKLVAEQEFFHARVLADYSSRTEDPWLFLRDHFLNHPILMGTGFSSYDFEFYYGSFRRLHSGVWDLLFQCGAIGLSLFLYVLWTFHRKARQIYRTDGNALFLLFAPIVFGINLTARLNVFYFWGYLLFVFHMNMEHRIQQKHTVFTPWIADPMVDAVDSDGHQ